MVYCKAFEVAHWHFISCSYVKCSNKKTPGMFVTIIFLRDCSPLFDHNLSVIHAFAGAHMQRKDIVYVEDVDDGSHSVVLFNVLKVIIMFYTTLRI